jgi:hypothetical protein
MLLSYLLACVNDANQNLSVQYLQAILKTNGDENSKF